MKHKYSERAREILKNTPHFDIDNGQMYKMDDVINNAMCQLAEEVELENMGYFHNTLGHKCNTCQKYHVRSCQNCRDFSLYKEKPVNLYTKEQVEELQKDVQRLNWLEESSSNVLKLSSYVSNLPDGDYSIKNVVRKYIDLRLK